MKPRKRRRTWIVLIPLLSICILLGFLAAQSGHLKLNLPITKKGQFSPLNQAQYPSRLHAAGNQILDESGKVILLRGLMAPDPEKLREKGKFNRAFLEAMGKTGANVIRIPVNVEQWVNDEYYLWRYLDPAVTWAGEIGIYVILDWHSIGNVVTGAGAQMPDVKHNSMDLAKSFWSTTSRYFRGAPHVIFEVFNEPESITETEWRRGAEQLIQVIRAEDAHQLIIVGGIDYGKDLSWVLDHPVSEANLAYASHIYPIHPAGQWDGWFGKVSTKYPVISTEWGYMDENRADKPAFLAGNRDNYGEPFLAYLGERGIGWVACWYDDEWLPPMFETGQNKLNEYGKFVLENLQKTD